MKIITIKDKFNKKNRFNGIKSFVANEDTEINKKVNKCTQFEVSVVKNDGLLKR